MTPRTSRPARCRPITLFAFTLGAAVLQLSPALPHPVFGIFLLLSAAAATLRWRSATLPAALVMGTAFAALVADQHLQRRLPMGMSGQSGEVIAVITGLPERDGRDWRFEARVRSSADFPMLRSRKIKLAWYRSDARLQPGDIWRLQVKLRVPNGTRNPGGFDAEKRALEKHWAAQGYVRESAAVPLGGSFSIDRYRERLSRLMAAALGPEQARFVQSLAIGDTRGLTDGDWEILRRTGITHLIAISGFHVGIVALAGSWLVFGLYRSVPVLGLAMARPQAMAMAATAAAWLYAGLAGFAVPTVRTALMIGVFMVCRLLLRQVSVLQAVAASMAIIVCFDTFALLSSGFWLSFGGVLLLAAFMPGTAGQGLLRPFVRAQWICTLGLMPLTVAFFSQTTLIGPIANMLAIPWISLVVVPLALLGCVFAGMPAISGAIWELAAWLMEVLWRILIWAGQSPVAALYFPEPSALAVLAALSAVVFLLMPEKLPGKWLGLLLLFPLLWPKLPDVPHGSFHVAMIDVGQGLSVLVKTRQHALLYDTGAGKPDGFSQGRSVIVPALRAKGIDHLDVAVISHGDMDHAGGLPAVRESIPVASLQASEGALPGGYQRCRAGQSWTWDGVQFRYLWPEADLMDGDNDRSCVLQVGTGRHRVLLTGDISAKAETLLIENHGSGLKSDVLFAPHHGSKSSSSAAFIDRVDPDIVLISSGFQNRFRHPNEHVIRRYLGLGAVAVNSADSGWAELAVSADGWSWLHRARTERKRYWQRSVTGTPVSDE